MDHVELDLSPIMTASVLDTPRRTFRGRLFRNGLLTLLVVVGIGLNVDAQTTQRSYRVGWLGHGLAVPEAERKSGDFQRALRDLGYVEGQNLAIEYRYADGKVDRLPELAAELVRLKVDVIVTSGEPAALAAKRATDSIPIVATEISMDPVKGGLVASLGRPEANVTGLATQDQELWPRRLALFKLIVTKGSRLSVLWNPANPGNKSCTDDIASVAPALGMRVAMQGVSDGNSLERALAAIAKDRPDALVICWDSITLTYAKRIATFALQQHLPTLAPVKEYLEAGMLMSYGTNLPAQRRLAASYVDKLLKGAKAGSLPVEQTQSDLVVNFDTSKALGLVPPAELQIQLNDRIP